MGSPIIPLIANLFMEEFEVKALSTAQHPPFVAKVCFVIQKAEQWRIWPRWISSLPRHQGHTRINNTLITIVDRTPTHTDQYLHWVSNHFIVAKHSVYNTREHRAKVVSSNQPSLLKELDHIRMTLQSCYFPTCAMNKLQHNFEHRLYTNNDLWHPRTRTPDYRKLGSYSNVRAHILTFLRSILERLAEHLGIGSKTPQNPIPHPPTQQLHRTPNQPRLFEHSP